MPQDQYKMAPKWFKRPQDAPSFDKKLREAPTKPQTRYVADHHMKCKWNNYVTPPQDREGHNRT